VEETLRLFRSFYRRGITVDEAIKLAQLEEKRRSRVGGLSGGQKQRLAMATALVGDPELLFLDEPTTGLDPQARRHLWELVEVLKQAGRTIILTTHYMEEAERLCDRVAIMDHGQGDRAGDAEGTDCDGGRRRHCGVCGEYFPVPKGEGPGAPISPPNQSLDGAPAPVVDVEALKAIPGVQSHRVDESLHQLSVSELHTAVPRFLRRSRRRDCI
jgi:ABC-2 type transport system ATP-binding protein